MARSKFYFCNLMFHQHVVATAMFRWEEMVSSVTARSQVWLTSRLPLYLWFQDDKDDHSHVLTDFFLEELLRTNVTGSNMFYLPESFQVACPLWRLGTWVACYLCRCPSSAR